MHITSNLRPAASKLSVVALATLCLALTACSAGGAPQSGSGTGTALASPATTKDPRTTPTATSNDPADFCQDIKMQFAALRFLPMSIGTDTEQETLNRTLTEVQQLAAAAPAGAEKEVANLEDVMAAFRNEPSKYDSDTLLAAMNRVEGWASTNC